MVCVPVNVKVQQGAGKGGEGVNIEVLSYKLYTERE